MIIIINYYYDICLYSCVINFVFNKNMFSYIINSGILNFCFKMEFLNMLDQI